MKKKLFSIILIAVMVLASVGTAFAGSITVNPADGDDGAHTYTAYQILKGDIIKENGKYVYSNVEWGDGVNKDDENKVEIGGKKYTAAEFLAEFKEGAVNSADAAKIKTVVTNGKNSVNNKISDLQNGYYFVEDTGTMVQEGKTVAATKYILINVLNEDRTIDSKSSVPSVEKKVDDKNDSNTSEDATVWQDSADYDIGDSIPFKVTATIGDGIANFTAYSFNFVDTMSAGLTLDSTVEWKIMAGDVDITDQFTLSSAGNVHTWAATNIKPYIADGTKVVLTYNAILNENAVIGSAGNPNTVKLEYDNNPNSCGNGTPEGDTPEDKNIVFTYKTIVNKVDGEKDPLTGASFKLEKKLADGTTKLIKAFDVTDQSSFVFEGLDDGDYVLTETKTPAGYNSVDPIEFTISAKHDVESAQPQLTELTGGDLFTGNVEAGSLTTEVVNVKGSVLPETGGMGTTIIYILGAALVVGAGVLLVSRKKMNDR